MKSKRDCIETQEQPQHDTTRSGVTGSADWLNITELFTLRPEQAIELLGGPKMSRLEAKTFGQMQASRIKNLL